MKILLEISIFLSTSSGTNFAPFVFDLFILQPNETVAVTLNFKTWLGEKNVIGGVVVVVLIEPNFLGWHPPIPEWENQAFLKSF